MNPEQRFVLAAVYIVVAAVFAVLLTVDVSRMRGPAPTVGVTAGARP